MSPAVPTQRDGNDETVSVLGMLIADVRGLRETVTAGFSNLATDIAKLREQTVSRVEFDRYRDEHRLDSTEARQAIGREIKQVRQGAADDLKALKEELAASSGLKRWVVTAMAGGAAALGAVGGLIEQIIHH